MPLLSYWRLCRLQVPQDLQREMLSQQAACDTIIASKDAIVAAMRGQLHQKDDEYVRMLKQQGEDVDLLLLNMGKQLEEMQTAYRDELAQIDVAYMQVHTTRSKRLTLGLWNHQGGGGGGLGGGKDCKGKVLAIPACLHSISHLIITC